ncbi:hypothetical protein Tco_0527275 [Tanacetum coccineum]
MLHVFTHTVTTSKDFKSPSHYPRRRFTLIVDCCFRDVPIQRTCKYGDLDGCTSYDQDTILGNLVKEEKKKILLKMNLPDHRSVLTDQEDQAKMEMEAPRSSGVNSPPNAHT